MSMIARVLAGARARWSLDENETRFVTEAERVFAPAPSGEGTRRVLVQMPPDYQCVIKFGAAVREFGGGNVANNVECVGLWHQSVMSAPREETMQGLRREVRKVLNWLDFRKWKRLYHAIGARRFVTLRPSVSVRRANWQEAGRIWQGLTSKDDVLAIMLNGTPCGDLIYDTYLRYRIQPTVDLADPFLRRLIAQALDAQHAIRAHLKEGRFERFFTNYSSYIQHGIPVREALRAGVEVFACGNLTQVYKRLTLEDWLHTEAHWHYGERFAALADKDTARATAEAELQKRFAGAIDRATAYMKSSAYAANASGALPAGVEGVVYLHDFFDSPHCYRSMVFPDYDAWARFTAKTIVEHNLPIAIKPHPNQLPESALVVQKLKAEFPSVTFLDPKLPNNIIFKAGIKCGISIYGTVLSELAYHGIAALAAGDNPHVDFDICIDATSVEDYREKLIGFRDLKAPANAKEQVLEFYYTHQFMHHDDLQVDFGPLDVMRLPVNQSIALKTVVESYPPLVRAGGGKA